MKAREPEPPPAPDAAAPDDPRARRVERAISGLLRWGVLASLLLVTAGTVLGFVRTGGYEATAADLGRLTGPGGTFPRDAAWLAGGVLAAHGPALVVLGLLVLIVTPVLRVVISVVAFTAQRDRVFVLLTAVVLALLVLSFFLGAAAA